MNPTIRLTQAVAGKPVRAECEDCGAEWLRPLGDPHSDTLTTWARAHLAECPGRTT